MCYNDVMVYFGCSVLIISFITACIAIRKSLLHNAVAVEPFRCPSCGYCEMVHEAVPVPPSIVRRVI